jgi:hypothetical protein
MEYIEEEMFTLKSQLTAIAETRSRKELRVNMKDSQKKGMSD